VLGGGALNPVKTQWGWTGQNAWRSAVREVEAGGANGILRAVGNKVPTYEEAVMLIEQARGTIQRVEGPHAVGGVAAHIDFPHINYTTPGGTKAHLQIQSLPATHQ
jgi:hypothetical protein